MLDNTMADGFMRMYNASPRIRSRRLMLFDDHYIRYRGIPMDPALQGVIAAIERNTFGDAKIFQPLISTLTVGKDFYLISADFASYIEANKQVDVAYKNQDEWTKKSIRCTANMGKFSSYVFKPVIRCCVLSMLCCAVLYYDSMQPCSH